MPKKPGQYASIAEVRSSLYPGAANMLNLEKEEIVEFPSPLENRSRKILDDIAKKAGESHIEDQPAADE